jgi:carbamoyltransferase
MMRAHRILGVFHCFHDASACLLENGRLVAMAEEERFNRRKHTAVFPENAIRFCLETAGCRISDVDVAYGFEPNRFFRNQVLTAIRGLPRSLHLLRPGASYLSLPQKVKGMYRMREMLRERFGEGPRSIEFVPHHLAHAYSTFFASPFESAAVFVLDGFGEEESTSFYRGEGDDLTRIGRVPLPHSLGVFYGAITQYLGFVPHGDEYKVMGMAAYGEDRHRSLFEAMLRKTDSLQFVLDQSYIRLYTHGVKQWYSERLVKELGPPRSRSAPYDAVHFDIAHSAQCQLERVVVALGRELREATGMENVCIAGGVGQNVLANTRILEDCGFEGIYVTPVAYDGGISLGSALAVHHRKFGGTREFVLDTAAWGPAYDDAECEAALRERGLKASRPENPARLVARAIAEGRVVGWFDGRMEVGPRALGSRSILADPRRDDIKEILNSRIKNREFFRPFAPMVLREACAEYFDLRAASPFMSLVGRVRKPRELPGITHRDGTARVQTVTEKQNPNIHRVLEEFRQVAGVPVLLNTSFNENEPIVCSPQQAIDCFLRTEMDMLVFNSRLVVERRDPS